MEMNKRNISCSIGSTEVTIANNIGGPPGLSDVIARPAQPDSSSTLSHLRSSPAIDEVKVKWLEAQAHSAFYSRGEKEASRFHRGPCQQKWHNMDVWCR